MSDYLTQEGRGSMTAAGRSWQTGYVLYFSGASGYAHFVELADRPEDLADGDRVNLTLEDGRSLTCQIVDGTELCAVVGEGPSWAGTVEPVTRQKPQDAPSSGCGCARRRGTLETTASSVWYGYCDRQGMSKVTVAVLNTNPDLLRILQHALSSVAFTAVTVTLQDIRSKAVDLQEFMHRHQPRVIVFDLAPPYDWAWTLLIQLRDLPVLRGTHFVLTSVNVDALHALVRTEERVYEVLGQPHDVDAIVQAVKEASRARAVRALDTGRASDEAPPMRDG